MIKQYKPRLYYLLGSLLAIVNFMEDKYIDPAIPLTLIDAGNILPVVKDNERVQWSDCLKAFGTMANYKFVFAKDAGHKVWKKEPSTIVNEIAALYGKVDSK